ncbi:MAG: xanthine dehydrogenase accessory factor [Candidatus Binatia bacterium]|jgi:xanthine dehydrogenase accessory factor
MPSFYDQLPELLKHGEPFALGVIGGVKGSSPQKQGAKALFFMDGAIVGTMGGGCLEAEIQERARLSLQTGKPATFDLVLDHDFGWDDGLICGGRVSGLIIPNAQNAADIWRELASPTTSLTWGVNTDYVIEWAADDSRDWLYRETVSPPCSLWIAGSGHIAQAVAPIARTLDFQVTLFDDRPSLANTRYFPSDTQFRVGSWEAILKEALSDRPTFGLIVTRGHNHDALVLRDWIQRPFAFLGMIGSRRKKRIIFEKFVTDELATEEQLERVACPVGLDINAVSVAEIGISIAAQLAQVRAENVLQRATGINRSSAARGPEATPEARAGI